MINIPNNIAIICHGGAWAIPDTLKVASLKGTEIAATIGWAVLSAGGSALDAVEKAVNSMEDNPVYNAGRGASLNEFGNIELDAIIIDGETLNFGAVASVKNVLHTVSLARKIMELSDHVIFVGPGANKFAREIGFPEYDEKNLITLESKIEWERYMEFKGAVDNLYNTRQDTVGAVAIDEKGNIAAATSTGGITAKRLGRVGDSPIIGSGAFADNNCCGVSTTGHGESILKVMLARQAAYNVEKGIPPMKATQLALEQMKSKVKGNGGLIVISNKCEIGYHFTSKRMAWAYMQNDILKSGI
ncbi:MAG: isoaspartyl peptidase/L-asparaginase [Candidatus Heimdallarchaeota archaeon]|nr:isoaspartyl peptidase/L-asparaginase [Candidatus Heimdallarchaeota archaeon]